MQRCVRMVGMGSSALLTASVLLEPPSDYPDKEEAIRAFGSRSTSSLLRSLVVYAYASSPTLVSATPTLLEWSHRLHLDWLSHRVVRWTGFKQFCGAENNQQATELLHRLHTQGLLGMLTVSIESSQDKNVVGMIANTTKAARHVENSFIAIKPSALVGQKVLVGWSTALLQAQRDFDDASIVGLEQFVTLASRYMHQPTKERLHKLFHELDRSNSDQLYWTDYRHMFHPSVMHRYGISLDDTVQQDILNAMEQLQYLASVASATPTKEEHIVGIMMDAEQSHIQPALAYLTRCLSDEFNTSSAVIYGTYQLYRTTGLTELEQDMLDAQRSRRVWGAKVVRGAYLNHEQSQSTSVVWPSKQHTDTAYHTAMDLILSQLSQQEMRVVFATHNQTSTQRALTKLHHAPPSLKHKVLFGQLYGMGDTMSTELVHQGYSVIKCVSFGQIHQVIPYLIRRAQENGAILNPQGAAARDTRGMRYILRRRFGYKTLLYLFLFLLVPFEFVVFVHDTLHSITLASLLIRTGNAHQPRRFALGNLGLRFTPIHVFFIRDGVLGEFGFHQCTLFHLPCV